jgi:DEAD/DEAH box helicase domain-containing protein
MGLFKPLVQLSNQRLVESTVSILGIADKHVRKHIYDQITEDGPEPFLSELVFEHTCGWQKTDETMLDYAGNLLSEEMVDNLSETETHTFPLDLQPYVHQRKAWKILTKKDPRSIIVTTGTGSGKTECFMIPIINDLVNEYQNTKRPLVGVRALFLYPLNALINSQQERLDSWTRRYESNIRFCLYNGNTVERIDKIKQEQKDHPNQILSRELLRKEPAPILMTNATMLEYMLVRQIDNPILELSKEEGSLRWIVLDEAHTYVGSQAAEISLLLRRVVQAFGKKSQDIRFIATSATIADEKGHQKLVKYLADLAGVPEDHVSVITGNRVWDTIDTTSFDDESSYDNLVKIESDSEISLSRYDALCRSRQARLLRKCFMDTDVPIPMSSLVSSMNTYLDGKDDMEKRYEVLQWLDLVCGTRKEECSQSFLPLRLHMFQRMIHGFWGCVDPNCSHKSAHLESWPFGTIYTKQRNRCECGAPVFELAFCTDCNAPYLLAEDKNGVLRQESNLIEEEHSLDEMGDDESGQDQIERNRFHTKNRCLIADQYTDSVDYISQQLDLITARIGILDGSQMIPIKMISGSETKCARCEKKSTRDTFFRRSHLGSAFYATTMVPTILEHCPDAKQNESDNKPPELLPGRGRKLITFTDSRQGTARLALKMQQEAERSKLRGLVFDQLKQLVDTKSIEGIAADADVEDLKKEAERLKKLGMKSSYAIVLETIKIKQAAMDPLSSKIRWNDMVDQLSEKEDMKGSILKYNQYANPILFGSGDDARTIARVLLLREFIRRPKNQNSLETLGLVRVTYQNLDMITKAPEYWTDVRIALKYQTDDQSKNTLTVADWKDYLKVILDFYVRENSYVKIGDSVKQWMGMRFYPKAFLPPDSHSEDVSVLKKWPTFENSPHGLRNRLVKLLIEATDFEYESQKSRDLINAFLKQAWRDLTDKNILTRDNDTYTLDPSLIQFSLNREAWVCPITNRLFDTTFCGLTPYLPGKMLRTSYLCKKVILPDFSSFKTEATAVSSATQMRRFCEKNAEIRDLRSNNLWSDISDRTLEGGFYYRTAEHSAQQSSRRLKMYESLFKKGKMNVLNCSTTMEMGVDIGGVTAIVMNNVPPHPANYLQRTGRAGRRGESQSVAYTLCKQDPHNQQAFSKPMWPFQTAIPAPTISLSSKTIVQRHVNSLVLSKFLLDIARVEKQNHTLRVDWFFNDSPSMCDKFTTWMDDTSEILQHDIGEIIRGTALSTRSSQSITQQTQERILDIQRRWVEEYERITSKLETVKDKDDHRKAVEIELSRHQSEYLLKELAEKAFLPGYGFPTHVVTFNNYNILDFKQKKRNSDYQDSREDNIFNYKESPSRSLDIAIREYAPGSTLVIDGRVYRSSGIHIPGYEANKQYAFDIAWECSHCGATGLVDYAYSNDQDIACPRCGSSIFQRYKKLILKPSGFAQDFYEELGNDVTSQKFIRSQSPRVQLKGTELSLPDPRCGSFQYGEEGSVFYHSSGEFENGFAICLKCGRSESMTAQDEYPKILRDPFHRPLHAKPQKGSVDKTCSKEHVRKNIHLGYEIKTDVVELFLKNPSTGLWLGSNKNHRDDDRTVALTLAVAIRNAIANQIGVSSAEMGYACRKDREIISNEQRIAIQIYDTASGGAGFVKAGLASIHTLLKEAIKALECPNDCETVCSHCLAAQDSRIEYNEIDRRLAKKWIEESDFERFLIDPEELYDIPNPKYCTYGPEAEILSARERSIRKESSFAISFFLGPLTESCDLFNVRFFDRIMKWRYNEKAAVQLNFCVNQEFDESLHRAMTILIANGIGIQSYRPGAESEEFFPFCQVVDGERVSTLYTSQDEDRLPGSTWMNAKEPSSWIVSDSVEIIQSYPLSIETITENKNASTLISIKKDLDGELKLFAKRARDLLVSTHTNFEKMLVHGSIRKITYSDRYLRSPWTVMLITEFMRVFCGGHIEQITWITTKNERSSNPYMIFHDWEHDTEIKDVAEQWIRYRIPAATEVQVTVESEMYEVPHAREMRIVWESGAVTKLLFDQGAGPWKCSVGTSYQLKTFMFNQVDQQIKQMKEKFGTLRVQRDEPWETYITIDHTL